MFCSIICVTDLSTVAASAPGYEASIDTDGGAIVGYCETGNVLTENKPASIIQIAITQAKIGRLIKKRAIIYFLVIT